MRLSSFRNNQLKYCQDISKVLLDVEKLKKGKSSATMDQIVGENIGGFNSPKNQRPFFKIFIHSMKVDIKETTKNPNVGQAYRDGNYGNQQWDKALDKINCMYSLIGNHDGDDCQEGIIDK
ncbi:hypothetical protein M9H77_16692 [Catharanthus roseus]|uniref:Uncharacterized protein n=1 Tax=Catharanthus roseus TaxID=4058 RepID=A0ACC0B2H8_CATRO|nr:hypothetical protein M9H77_16692 [Catharanthus roseus]